MEILRVYWPSLLGLLLFLLHLIVFLGRHAREGIPADGSSRGDRFFSLLVSVLLLILLLGAQIANRTAYRDLAAREKRSIGAEEALSRANQEWSLKLLRVERERDSLRTALDATAEKE